MKRILVVLLAAFAMSACNLGLIKTPKQRLAASCAVVNTSIEVLTAANELGKLTKEQQDVIIKAMGVTIEICGVDPMPTLDDLKQRAFEEAIAALQREAAKASEKQP